jgi:hypothetical protein
MKLRDFKVTVNTFAHGLANTALEEYASKQTISDNTISSYIASQVGQQFFILVENEHDHDASVVFYVDGQMASVLLCYAKPKHNSVFCLGVQPEAGLLRRFVFSRATLTGSYCSLRRMLMDRRCKCDVDSFFR